MKNKIIFMSIQKQIFKQTHQVLSNVKGNIVNIVLSKGIFVYERGEGGHGGGWCE